jgi:phosphatidylserine/phosphatidylglycerophosphate/cardiolipin synthase-like enzyme
VRELVPLAVVLQRLAGGPEQALAWVDTIASKGRSALSQLGLHSDAKLVLADQAQTAGLFVADGKVNRVRLAQLVIVLDILAMIPRDPVIAADAEPLVFTVPHAAERLVTPRQRLDLLVNDVIARAESSLHIGGPFWNEGGWSMLRPVVLPALQQRGVIATFYLHPHESGRLDVVHEMLAEARVHGEARALWWAGGLPSLMHAKFIVSDRSHGYFGTANLTSLGLGEHLEMGVALAPMQAASLLTLLESLEQAGLFTPDH